jgi:hypothetical protein
MPSNNQVEKVIKNWLYDAPKRTSEHEKENSGKVTSQKQNIINN